jgi:hypothetical protein
MFARCGFSSKRLGVGCDLISSNNSFKEVPGRTQVTHLGGKLHAIQQLTALDANLDFLIVVVPKFDSKES